MKIIIKKTVLWNFIAGIILLIISTGNPAGANFQYSRERPRLAVIMVVDQMRADYLTRWSSLYTGGLHRLLTEGVVYSNAHHDHAATVTAVGHATIATGSHPARHGIVGNSFYDRALKRKIAAVADSSTIMVGGSGGMGASPLNLMHSTIGDWLKEASPSSMVFAVALKDRAAVLFGGKNPDCAFWYNSKNGDFVTSTYYAEELPGWAAAFNNSGEKDIWKDSIWVKMKPGAKYQGQDTVLAEKGGGNSGFPHTIIDPKASNPNAYYYGLYDSPFGDALLLKFCQKLLQSEKIGEDTIPDLFMISLSAADLVGHDYGPDSYEIEDYYLRLDAQLGQFLDSLDAFIGEENYVFVLTSDHGVGPLPELAVSEGMPDARRVGIDEFRNDLARMLAKAFPGCDRAGSLLIEYDDGFMVDSAIAAQCGMMVSEVERKAAAALEKLDYVADVFTFDQLMADTTDSRPFARLFRNSFYPQRALDLVVNFKEGVLLTSSPRGTSHGSPYNYDTHVPIIIYSPGHRPGINSDPVRSVDIVPTVALLLRINPDSQIDGRALPGAK